MYAPSLMRRPSQASPAEGRALSFEEALAYALEPVSEGQCSLSRHALARTSLRLSTERVSQ